jgi:hypothetical protein
VSRIHEEHPEFITEWAVGGNVPGNTEFMATGCLEANKIFYVAHPRDAYVSGRVRYSR